MTFEGVEGNRDGPGARRDAAVDQESAVAELKQAGSRSIVVVVDTDRRPGSSSRRARAGRHSVEQGLDGRDRRLEGPPPPPVTTVPGVDRARTRGRANDALERARPAVVEVRDVPTPRSRARTASSSIRIPAREARSTRRITTSTIFVAPLPEGERPLRVAVSGAAARASMRSRSRRAARSWRSWRGWLRRRADRDRPDGPGRCRGRAGCRRQSDAGVAPGMPSVPIRLRRSDSAHRRGLPRPARARSARTERSRGCSSSPASPTSAPASRRPRSRWTRISSRRSCATTGIPSREA